MLACLRAGEERGRKGKEKKNRKTKGRQRREAREAEGGRERERAGRSAWQTEALDACRETH